MSPSLIISLLLAGIVHHAKGYASGPPSSMCNGMTPTTRSHGSPQTSSSPYYISIDKTTVGVGQTISGTLSGSTTFDGYMIEAKDSSGNIYGSFTNLGYDMQTLNCGGGQALGHTSSADVQSIKFVWNAPTSISGTSIQLTFYYTGMQSRYVHWSNMASGAVFTVTNPNGNANSQAPSQETTTDYSYYYYYYDYSESSTSSKAPISSSSPSSASTNQNLSSSPSSQNSNVYTQCGSLLGCYGSDKDCIAAKSCGILMTYQYHSNLDSFNLGMFSAQPVGKSNYISIALSFDDKMGDDLVFACSPSFTSIKTSWNIGYENSNAVSGVQISSTLISNTDSSLACSFSIPATFNISGVTAQSFDLANKNYFLMTAHGINQDSDNIGMHDERSSSDTAVVLRAATILQTGKANLLLQIHGALMAVAWLGCVPIGMVAARYFKPMCPNVRPLGLSCWLMSHQVTSYSATLLTIIALVVSFLAVGTKSLSLASLQINPHSVIGLLTCIMTFIQVMYAFCRPGPGSSLRSCFAWTHWGMGNATFILGIASIFLSVNLAKLRMDNNYYTALIIYVIATGIAYGLLECFRMSGRNSAMIADIEFAEKVENLRMTSRNVVGLFYIGFCLCFSLAFTVGVFSV